MDETPKRLAPATAVLRRLYLLSGNQCAFPSCRRVMIDENGAFVGQVCHIEAAEPGGERFNAAMTNAQRSAFENLMLMCYEHHVATDDVEAYPTEFLREMKLRHEAAYADADKKLAGTFTDLTQAQELVLPRTYAKMREVWDLGDLDVGKAYEDYARLLQQVTPAARELLLVISRRSELGPARYSEIRAVTGSGDEEIVETMRLLEKHKLASVSDDEDLAVDPVLRPYWRKGWLEDDVLAQLKDFAERSGRPIDDIVVHLRFDLLD
ncbi:MAG: hypothetical protein JWM87_1547 [Candidatus Eremiobacteraeota bacterium]|nr:hypothetical protein [Candidatus Eremiobacteraeota bacterium]